MQHSDTLDLNMLPSKMIHSFNSIAVQMESMSDIF